MVELIDINDYDGNKIIFKQDIWDRIMNVMNDVVNEASNGEFTGNYDRLALAPCIFLITYNNIDVGYVYFANEYRYGNALFIDMVIKKDYRSNGIGKYVLNRINSIYNGKEFLIGEVKKDNIPSNNISNKVGILIYQGNYNYYLIQKNRIDVFNEYNKDHLFEESMDRDTISSKVLLKELYNNI